MLSRRQFLTTSALVGTGLVLSSATGRWALAQVPLLDPLAHPKFVTPLPRPTRIDATRGGRFNAQIRETTQSLGLETNGNPLMTTVWGYRIPGNPVTFPGPTVVAHKDRPVSIRWMNQLKEQPPGEAYFLPLDTSIHLAIPERLPKQGVPAVTHLHGGHTESASDGLPEAWFTNNFKETGPAFVKRTYNYDNDQEAATLWYHDHALGVTRLNVYAGLAGFYLLRDDNENQLIADDVLPAGPYEVEIVIQDRMFTSDGQLFLPSDPNALELPPGSPDPSIVAEFFGDFILVNGAAWPLLDVEPRKYRFRVLNGSDSRFYVLALSNGMNFLQIGSDNGLLEQAVELTQLVIAPGERADLVVDFAGMDGAEINLRNFGPDAPFKGLGIGGQANPATTGQIMKFAVSLAFDTSVSEPTVAAGTLLNEITPLVPTVSDPRQLVLFEGEDQFGRLRPQLGTLADGSLLWDEPITETPGLNDVEIWEVYNATEDAHPIHLHLVAFQVLNRQGFTGDAVVTGEDPIEGGTKQELPNVVLNGDARDPEPNERGWKDTVRMLPGEVTRIIARFDRPGRYVWHCHILSHEDHEMMRPYNIG